MPNSPFFYFSITVTWSLFSILWISCSAISLESNFCPGWRLPIPLRRTNHLWRHCSGDFDSNLPESSSNGIEWELAIVRDPMSYAAINLKSSISSSSTHSDCYGIRMLIMLLFQYCLISSLDLVFMWEAIALQEILLTLFSIRDFRRFFKSKMTCFWISLNLTVAE